ncbi:MAG: prepilin-type N-terminal cleavage/methylation domain-containing protein [Candidatus Shapirobacteria bacterium]|nr:prepilin-type N-terminal cleavage/methylation domain-containing protein [Candidatus Shapirobacteria bacterium]MDD4410384.1 prepilin-type N-terminal cleavage/methylation domain-containing protein [Candidatus Shapirobacteria bacterium]
MNKLNIKKGFTLVELLVVISIMGILTVISLSSFTTAQVKARDAQRKSDLDQVSKALMLYYSDTGTFPALASSDLFGQENGLSIGVDPNIVYYMRKTPQDPKSPTMVYEYKTDGKSFNLFANLENTKDSQCPQPAPYTVGGVSYCYGVASPNTTLKSW